MVDSQFNCPSVLTAKQNWPLWKRDLILAILSFMAVMCSTMSSIMAANTVTISMYYEVSFTSAALLTGYHLCGVGVAGILIVPTARVWGKRHLFLLGNILMVASCAWAGASGHNYDSLLWARIFQGVALAPFEALVNACVGDLFFLHVCLRFSRRAVMLTGTGTRQENGIVKRRSFRCCFPDPCPGGKNYPLDGLAVDFLLRGYLHWRWFAADDLFGPGDSIQASGLLEHRL